MGALVAMALGVAGYAIFEAISLAASWASVERVSIEAVPPGPRGGRESTPLQPTTTPAPRSTGSTSGQVTTTSLVPNTTATSDPGLLERAEAPPSVMLLVGSDSRVGLEDTGDFGDFRGQRADVIVLAMRDGEQIGLLSVPRDLYVEDLCDGGRHRISAAFSGCGETNGLAHLVRELENVTDLHIEHAAAVDLAGFQNVIDQLGGYEICTEYHLRDVKSGLDLDAGCTVADGETTLQWLRSRRTERLVDGLWEDVPAVSDLTRNQRQRELLVDLLHRQARRSDPGVVLSAIKSVAPHLRIDDRLSLGDAAAWLWDFRSAEVETVEIPVTSQVTPGGSHVLVPSVDVARFASGIPS
jgi:LCP family protein required for cell wall assembly